MSAMNKHSWAYEINKDLIASLQQNRHVKTILLSSWLFEELWDVVLKNGIETRIDLRLSNDNYELTADLTCDQRKSSLTLELLA